MIPPHPLLSARRFGPIAIAACLALWPIALPAQQPPVNWPIPTLPPGGNPATFPVPKNDWMSHFQRSLDRTKQGHVDLVFDGDSITDFWQGTGKEVWAKNYGKLNAVDFGISGDRTENLLWRVDAGQLNGLHPKLIVLMIGTNDTGECSDVQIADGVTAVLRAYQKACPTSVILLHGIFPRANNPNDSTRLKIKRINAIISRLGDGNRVIYQDFGDKFLQPDGTLIHDLMPDSLHPSAKGYEVWADAIRPTVNKVFGAAPGATP